MKNTKQPNPRRQNGLFRGALISFIFTLITGLFLSVGCGGSRSDNHSSPVAGIQLTDAVASTASWQGKDFDNNLISMRVVPGIGGRVLQYSLGDYGFFWINPELEGKEPPANRLGPDNGWLNYGGDKLWPSPQGWDGAHQWPGPPDAVLDGGPYQAEVGREDKNSAYVSLISEKDERSGLQFSRVIRMFEGTTHVSIDATMKNIDSKPRRWGIWPHTQFDASDRGKTKGYNQNYWAYCSLNSKSVHEGGYKVLFGRPENPAYKPDYKRGLMRVHYEREVGKIGIDSDGGWVATVDGTAGKVFVQRFVFESDKVYPNQASVEFWMNGHGQIEAYNQTLTMPEDETSNPHVFESELIGPYTELQAGESSSFHYDWYAASIGGNYPVLDCSEVGVVCEPLSAVWDGVQLRVSGRFGVFLQGTAKLVFKDKDGGSIAGNEPLGPVSPLTPLVLDSFFSSSALEDAAFVELFIMDAQGRDEGILARVECRR